MTKEKLAELLYDESCRAQWRRMHPKESPTDADPRKVGGLFESLNLAAKDNYLAMANLVLVIISEKVT